MAAPRDESSPLGPEVIMVAHRGAELRLHGSHVRSSASDVAPLARALEETTAAARPLFGPSEDRVRARLRESAWEAPDLSVFYRVELDEGADAEAVASRLTEEESVVGVYVKPAPIIDAPDAPGEPPDVPATRASPNFEDRQGYLEAPPGGVNARSAWNSPGGDGSGVQVVIVGGAWRRSHEDLAGAAGAGVIDGKEIDSLSFRNHGTAMLGIVRANRNGLGVTGIAPACEVRQVATFGVGTSAAIHKAAEALPAGGILLIEWQRPGPGATGVGAAGAIPLEWWPDDLAAIQFATGKQVIVVEPAGNGGVDLDDPRYDQPLPGFPTTWRNPFERGQADSGAVLVGAGAPPPGTHNRDRGPDCSRLAFSNWGSVVDVQAWGAEITTVAYGDLQSGPEDIWYTDVFGGTSGASAMVAGVLAALQGAQLAGGKRGPLSPADARSFLRATGSPQQDGSTPAATQPIGSRPELLALIAMLTPTKDEAKEGKDGKDTKDTKDSKETKETKDTKDSKDNKDKDGKDNKESKDNKDRKDHKEDKGDKGENQKELKDRLPKEDRAPEQPRSTPAVPAGTTWPVHSTEPVRHFIPSAARPDLSAAALLDEPDMAGRRAVELAAELRGPAEAPSDG